MRKSTSCRNQEAGEEGRHGKSSSVCGLDGWLKWSARGGWLVGWFAVVRPFHCLSLSLPLRSFRTVARLIVLPLSLSVAKERERGPAQVSRLYIAISHKSYQCPLLHFSCIFQQGRETIYFPGYCQIGGVPLFLSLEWSSINLSPHRRPCPRSLCSSAVAVVSKYSGGNNGGSHCTRHLTQGVSI